jgi:hypothetical protein
LPLAEGLEDTSDIPHTISFAMLYRLKINSFGDLPKDKQPPRKLWDRSHALDEFFDEVFERNKGEGTRSENFVEFNPDDVE